MLNHDVNMIRHIVTLGENRNLSLKQLHQKLAILVALVGANKFWSCVLLISASVSIAQMEFIFSFWNPSKSDYVWSFPIRQEILHSGMHEML